MGPPCFFRFFLFLSFSFCQPFPLNNFTPPVLFIFSSGDLLCIFGDDFFSVVLRPDFLVVPSQLPKLNLTPPFIFSLRLQFFRHFLTSSYFYKTLPHPTTVFFFFIKKKVPRPTTSQGHALFFLLLTFSLNLCPPQNRLSFPSLISLLTTILIFPQKSTLAHLLDD